jgi:glutaconate CoA-transferase subunit B
MTDIGVLEPDHETRELTLVQVHEDVEPDHVREHTGWTLAVATELALTRPPSEEELQALRERTSR